MPRLPQEKIDEIRQSVDIMDVIGQYLPIKKNGRNYVAICPFHNDTRPSLSISQQKQIYMCFVCHNGGNVFTFLQEYLHISFIEAVKIVAELGHVDIDDYATQSYTPKISKDKQVLYDMNQEANSIYQYYLHTQVGTLASDYLIRRGFDDDLLKTFQIGYAPSKHILYQAFLKKNYQEIDMVKSGLVLESSNHYDRFQDRIMFPIKDSEGRIVGFSGRIYKNGDQQAKYMNSPESDIFIKGQILYHFSDAAKDIRKEGFVYLLEGFMDVIAMYRAGHNNTLALMGTALTNDHMRLLKRVTNTVVLCLDGDLAGQSAALKSAELLQKQSFDVKCILLPEGKDPDEIYTKEGKEGLDTILKHTMSPIEFMLEYESKKRDMTNYDDRRYVLDKGIEAINHIRDRIDRNYYVEQLSKLTQFSIDIINEQLTTPQKEVTYTEIVKQYKKPVDTSNKYKKAESDLLYYMLLDKSVCDQYVQKAGFMYDDNYRILASYIVDYYKKHKDLDVADFIDYLDGREELIHTLTQVASKELPVPYEQKAIDDYINKISLNSKQLKKQQLLAQFNATNNPLLKSQILQEIIDLEKETI